MVESPAVETYLARIADLAPLVREHATTSERDGRLATPIVEALHEAGLFRILLPRSLGGGGLTIPESIVVFEAMARLDASVAWNLSICADGPLFGHFLSRDAYETVFDDPRAVIAGTLNPLTIRAVRCDGGWRYSGRANYVSGSAQATWLVGAGIELHDDAPRMVDGFPIMRAAIMPFRHCTILDTWHVSGMRGTGSNDCTFEDVFVPDDFTFAWPEARSPWCTGAFGTVPLATQLGSALAAVAIGTARHAIAAVVELATMKVPAGTRALMRERPLAQMQIAQAQGWVEAAHAYLSSAVARCWQMGEAGEPFDNAARAAARLASVTAVKLAAQAVDLVHDAAGMNAVQTSSELDRCWRDLHTMTQHVILGTGRYEIVGRILMGLEPGFPII